MQNNLRSGIDIGTPFNEKPNDFTSSSKTGDVESGITTIRLGVDCRMVVQQQTNDWQVALLWGQMKCIESILKSAILASILDIH